MDAKHTTGSAVSIPFLMVAALLLAGCADQEYRTFADYPGFREYYGEVCCDDAPPEDEDRQLLRRFRPRIYLPPGGRYPIDFYRDYVAMSVLRRYPGGEVLKESVRQEDLNEFRCDTGVYLEYQTERARPHGLDRRVPEGYPPERKPVVYGRLYRETLPFPDGGTRELVFLKYNIVFSVSGLPVRLLPGFELLLRLAGLDPDDWHELDNFVAVHVVLDGEAGRPVAVLLAQHNHHRTYLVGRHLPLPEDGRLAFDIALRSNEVYPASDSPEPVRHRAVRRGIHMKYLLSGEDPPFFRGHDVTYGARAGGEELLYELAFLAPCDAFHTARMMLGEPRSFLGQWEIGRDGPPGADYYALPGLLPLGRLLQFAYLQEGDPEDIALLEEAVDIRGGRMDVERIVEHGGRKLFRDLARPHEE